MAVASKKKLINQKKFKQVQLYKATTTRGTVLVRAQYL